MTASSRYLCPLIVAFFVAGCSAGGSSSLPPPASMPVWQAKHQAHEVCPQVVGKPSCLVLLADSGIMPLCSPSADGCGFTPADLQARYKLTPYLKQGSGTIVAVIEEGDSSEALSDLTTYRKAFHLGKATFAKYNQKGQKGDYPADCSQFQWCVETELDIEMVAASCPKCSTYLMESDGTIAGLEAAETHAAKLGATLISNSWTCYISWTCGDQNLPNYFEAPGVLYLASSGDYGENYIGAPAALKTVVAVGGTQLTKKGSGFSEIVWYDAGGGCANVYNVGEPGVDRPAWQNVPHCTHRSVADVSAQAGCEPGVAEYEAKSGGWFGVCGTSVAAPLMAGIFAIAGNASQQDGGKTFWEKPHRGDFHDVCAWFCRFSHYYYGGGWGSPKGLKGL